MDAIGSVGKRRGFVYPSSEIYGGLGSAWDYGPLGVELANNVRQAWWRWMVYERDDIEGLDSSIILNPLVWKYSGHEATFSDPLVDCKKCKSRFRADKLHEEYVQAHPEKRLTAYTTIVNFAKKDIQCPNCSAIDWTDPRMFNLMLET